MKGGVLVFSVLLVLVLSVTVAAQSPRAAQTVSTQTGAFNSSDSILRSFDEGDYSNAERQLRQLRVSDPARFESLPFGLLYAKSAWLAGDLSTAAQLYGSLSSDPRLSRYAVLPLARILAKQEKPADAIRFYQEYLRHSSYPAYAQVAFEAMQYCDGARRPNDLMATARIASQSRTIDRMATYYIAKAYLMQSDTENAKSMLRSLMRSPKRDDAAALALSTLDPLDGASLNREDLTSRGRLAYAVWNFALAQKYLKPVALDNIQNSYFYGRALYFLGDESGSKTAFEKAIELWPNDSWTRFCVEQYDNLCIRSGDQKKAQELLEKLDTPRAIASTYRLIQALRADSKFEEALRLLEPYTGSRDSSNQARAIFLRGRIRFQQGLYREAFTDFDLLLKRRPRNLDTHEIEFWMAMVLQKMNHSDEALRAFASLAQRDDYFGALAREKTAPPTAAPLMLKHECAIPDMNEDQVRNDYRRGEDAPALLHLHLYDEMSQNLSPPALVKFLGMERSPKPIRYLEIAHVAGLAGDYPTANYYSDLFARSAGDLSGAPQATLRILFPWAYRPVIERFSHDRNVDPLLVLAIMKQESHFKPLARSQVFARGLMQLIPGTADQLATTLGLSSFNVDQLYSPDVNVNLGTKYLQEMAKQFGSRVDILAAAYNGGEDNTRIWLAAASSSEPIEFYSNIDFAQTRDYVRQVRVNYERYRRAYGGSRAN